MLGSTATQQPLCSALLLHMCAHFAGTFIFVFVVFSATFSSQIIFRRTVCNFEKAPTHNCCLLIYSLLKNWHLKNCSQHSSLMITKKACQCTFVFSKSVQRTNISPYLCTNLLEEVKCISSAQSLHKCNSRLHWIFLSWFFMHGTHLS